MQDKDIDLIKRQLSKSKMELHSFQVLVKKSIEELSKIGLNLANIDLETNYEAPYEMVTRFKGEIGQKAIPSIQRCLNIVDELQAHIAPVVEKINEVEDGLSELREE